MRRFLQAPSVMAAIQLWGNDAALFMQRLIDLISHRQPSVISTEVSAANEVEKSLGPLLGTAQALAHRGSPLEQSKFAETETPCLPLQDAKKGRIAAPFNIVEVKSLFGCFLFFLWLGIAFAFRLLVLLGLLRFFRFSSDGDWSFLFFLVEFDQVVF